MTEPHMDKHSRDLILAAEISGLIHDLGKLWLEFAREKMGEANYRDAAQAPGFNDAHGATLEKQRPYPPASKKSWVEDLNQPKEWAQILALPNDWIASNTCQARGLGDPLRQHHAIRDTISGDRPTFLGDLYSFGADIRDSALDKGAGGTAHSEQRIAYGFIADSFGNEDPHRPYGPKRLRALWLPARRAIKNTLLADGAWKDVPKAREEFLQAIEVVFRKALGETRRPTNDVTLWHHAMSTANLFKAAVAEGVLRQDFSRHWQNQTGAFEISRMGRVRFRLLGIRWDWAALVGSALQPVVLTAMAENRRKAIAELRQRLEVDYPVGNQVYADDNGVVFVVGGFYQGLEDANGQQAEDLFQKHILNPLQSGILQDLAPLGAGVAVRLAWTKPRLYLTDYPEVMATHSPLLPAGEGPGVRERLLQIGESELRALWARQTGDGQQVQICPQCGLRPGQARELAINESGLNADDPSGPSGFCHYCQTLVANSAYRQRRNETDQLFGFEPESFNLQEIRRQRNPAGNARMVLLSVRVNPEIIASGAMLLTQLARPLADLNLFQNVAVPTPNEVGETIQQTLAALAADVGDKKLNQNGDWVRKLLGDKNWLTKKDGRAEGTLKEKARHLLDEFFLREFIPDDAGLYRHDGDKLLLFGMRKHASPGRLARTWDDLGELWRQILWDIAGDTQHWLMPLSLDAGGFRIIVAANDARNALKRIQQRVTEKLGKVHAGLDVHVSALAFREKFPLYIALDALRRMERRIANVPAQEWRLNSILKRQHDGAPVLKPEDVTQEVVLNWQTPQGPTQWTVSLRTGDPHQPDLWYPHAICVSRDPGPGRLVRLDQLEAGEKIRLRPSTFDFMALDGTTRRYDLRYDAEGRRPHFILGESGRRPYLLEQLPELLQLAAQTGWNVSQTKGLIGQIIECYEKWVRDVPAKLRPQGREAWRGHCEAIFRRYLKDKEVRDRLIALFQDEERACLLFDAFEWSGFIEKDAPSDVEESEAA